MLLDDPQFGTCCKIVGLWLLGITCFGLMSWWHYFAAVVVLSLVIGVVDYATYRNKDSP